jgi:branched-chain amino acid transport system permease protein
MVENFEFIWADFVQYLLNGVSQGSIYALIALGYTMVYGILKLINFAHGEFYMVGAFFGLWLFTLLGLPLWAGLLLSMLLNGVLAVAVERIAYRPLRKAKRIAPLITAVGVSIVLLEVMRVIAGPAPKSFPTLIENKVWEFPLGSGSFLIQKTQVINFVAALMIMALLRFIVVKTKMGQAMRAASMDFDACRLMGIPLNRVIAFTFFLGASLAGLAGVLAGLYFNQVEPYMGQLAGLKAFTAAVLGGIGSLPGALIGSMVLGIFESLTVGYLGSSYRDAIVFAVLILVLMVRPWGLLGKPERVKV